MAYIASIFFGIGLFYILCDVFKVPYVKVSKANGALSKRDKASSSGLESTLGGVAKWLSKIIKIDQYKRSQMEIDLQTAQMDITPEMFRANCIVKASIIGIFAIPVLFFFPLGAVLILAVAIFTYFKESRSIYGRIRTKRSKIEYELSRFVFTIGKSLKHSRDVLTMIETYAINAGPELKHELNITAADMRSGNYETAISRLDKRVGSSMMSDVCRGFIGVIRGDDTTAYWATLAEKFSEYQRQQLKLRAEKAPKKVKKLSVCLLICFMLVFVVVIFSEIMNYVGVLFI